MFMLNKIRIFKWNLLIEYFLGKKFKNIVFIEFFRIERNFKFI